MIVKLSSSRRIACAALFGAVLTLSLIGFGEIAAQPKFDRARWIEAGEGTDWQVTEKHMRCIRGPMVRDLTSNFLKPGMPKEAVFQLLGRPDAPLRSNPNCFYYTLGFCRFPHIDYDDFTVCFDEHSRLKRY